MGAGLASHDSSKDRVTSIQESDSVLASESSVQKQEATSMTETKPKKKICCACPETKKLRDECIVQNGEDACSKWIEAHKTCLRSEGFNV